MPLRYLFKQTFQKTFDKLDHKDQRLIIKALEALDEYFETNKAPYGLRVTKLYGNSSAKTFEARVTINLRIVWVQTKEEVIFSLIGNHDDIRRFLKNL